MAARPLRIGVAGLGRAFTLMVPTLAKDPRVELVADKDELDHDRRHDRERGQVVQKCHEGVHQ